MAALVFVVHSHTSEACSIATDYASEPEVVRAFDAAFAPAAPTVFDAYISHDYEDSVGCPGTPVHRCD
jgi:hypothetical protein